MLGNPPQPSRLPQVELLEKNLEEVNAVIRGFPIKGPLEVWQMQLCLGYMDSCLDLIKDAKVCIVDLNTQAEILATVNLMTRINRGEIQPTKSVRRQLRAGIARARSCLHSDWRSLR